MKLARVDFENVMELEGSIEFPEGKTVIVYGENKAGKSNIIHALRYAFLSKVVGSRRASGYDELKLVTGREMAPAEGVGKITVDFEHDGRQFEIRREIDRIRLAAHVSFPGIRAGFTPTTGLFLTAEGASNFSS